MIREQIGFTIDGWTFIFSIGRYPMRRKASLIANVICVGIIASNCLFYADSVVRAEGIEINPTNFPDNQFRQYVLTTIDDGDSILSSSEISSVKKIKVSNKSISDMTGLEYFTGLTDLYCNSNQLTDLNTSNNTKLSYLNCSNNQLTDLDVSSNIELSTLICTNNKLTSLNISKNKDLLYLYCSNNQLEALDVNYNSELVWLECESNPLTELDVSNNKKLKYTNCDIEPFYGSGCVALNPTNFPDPGFRQYLTVNYGIKNSILTSDNISAIGALNIVDKSIHDLTGIEYLTSLSYLNCSGNEITSLDLSKNTNLSYVDCSNNKLTELVLGNSDRLSNLLCSNNQLTELDISHNPNLTKLECYGNRIADIDISNSDLLNVYTESTEVASGTHSELSYLYWLSDTKPYSGLYTDVFTKLYDEDVELERTQEEATDVVPTPTPTADPTPSEEPTPSPDPTPSGEPTPTPTEDPTPTTAPVGPTPSPAPTLNPTPTPTKDPTPTTNPGKDPAPTSGGEPTPIPTKDPTPTPTEEPTPTTPNPTKAPELSVGDFVNRCYSVALGRDADEEGFNYWVDSLNNGQACGAQVGYGFIFSGEYLNKNTSDEQYVTDLYSMYFGREADDGGYNYWLDLLKNGTTRETVFAGFANSEEFYNLCQKYGVVSGLFIVGVPNEQQGGVNCFVARLYKVCLNRLPDIGGQVGWVMKLMNGEAAGSTAAYGFVFSQEFINLNLNDTDFVCYMYCAFFGREADEDGLNYWVQKLGSGTAAREDVFYGFSGSAEFAQLCAGYGINVY